MKTEHINGRRGALPYDMACLKKALEKEVTQLSLKLEALQGATTTTQLHAMENYRRMIDNRAELLSIIDVSMGQRVIQSEEETLLSPSAA